MIYLPFFLLFIGDVVIPIGESGITVPLGMVLIIPLIFSHFLTRRVYISTPALLLLSILAAGAIGAAFTPQSNIARSAAGSLPLLFAALALLLYKRRQLDVDKIADSMIAGGTLLASMAIVLALISLGSIGDYYEQKLLIETPLGRSNYLSAFFIFLVALCLPKQRLLAVLFSVAVFSTLSRGGALMLALFFVAIPLARRGKLWWLAIGSFAAFLAIMYVAASGATEVIEEFIDPTDERLLSSVNRLLIWTFGLDIWQSHPILGVGPNTFRTFVEGSDNVEDVWGVHNAILLMLLNYGLAGTCLYAYYLRTIYYAIVQAEQHDDRFIYIRAVFAVLLVFSLFEPLVGSAAFELLVAFIYILSVAAVRKQITSGKDMHPTEVTGPIYT